MGLLTRFSKKREQRDRTRAAELARAGAPQARAAIIEHEQRSGTSRRELAAVIYEDDPGDPRVVVIPRDEAIAMFPRLLSLREPLEPPSFKLAVHVGTASQSYDIEERIPHG